MGLGPEPQFCPHCGQRLQQQWVTAEKRDRLVCTGCRRIKYLNPTVAACTIPVAADGRIMLVQRAIEPGYGLWVIPGGYVDLGETVRQAAVRETREETGVDVKLTNLVDAYSYSDSSVVVVVYEAVMLADKPRVGDECLDVALFESDNIPWQQLAFRTTREALQDFLAGGQGNGYG